MNHSKIGTRYAKALMLGAIENNVLDAVKNDLIIIDELLKVEDGLTRLLNSPVIRSAQKLQIIEEVLGTFFNKLTFDFLKLLIRNKRESHLAEIIRNYYNLYRKQKGIVTARLTSPVATGSETMKQVSGIIEKSSGKKVEITEVVNPAILGGFILQVEDLQYDASIRSRLEQIRQALINTPIE
jgi:F-type H+-transporting ATPase subunit delta